MAQVKRLYNLV